jgi:acyl-CoA synthetase (AMP-forming)/AMP-acid ligase II
MIQVIDHDSGVQLGPNEVGEICVQSPFMMTEYLNNPEVSSGRRHRHQMCFLSFARFDLIFFFGRKLPIFFETDGPTREIKDTTMIRSACLLSADTRNSSNIETSTYST